MTEPGFPKWEQCLDLFPKRCKMRVVKRRTLKNFWEKHKDCENALKAWLLEMKHGEFDTPAAIKARFRSADPIAGNRVVFNIKGNQYRLVVKFHYNTRIAYIRFIDTHDKYDKINAETV